METPEITNIVLVTLFPAVIVLLWHFYKKDAKTSADRLEALENRFEKRMEKSDEIINELRVIARELQIKEEFQDGAILEVKKGVSEAKSDSELAIKYTERVESRVDELERKNNQL